MWVSGESVLHADGHVGNQPQKNQYQRAQHQQDDKDHTVPHDRMELEARRHEALLLTCTPLYHDGERLFNRRRRATP